MDKYTIEWIGAGSIDLFTVGVLMKDEPLECSKEIAAEFVHAKGFKVTGINDDQGKRKASKKKEG